MGQSIDKCINRQHSPQPFARSKSVVFNDLPLDGVLPTALLALQHRFD